MTTRTLVAAVAFVLGSAAMLAADTKIEYKATEGGGAGMGTTLIGSGKIRSDTDATNSVIIDPNPTTGAMYLIDHTRKSVTKITRADLDAILKQMNDMMAQIPPEMQAMIKGRMGNAPGMPPPSKTVDTGERATVAGKSCRIFRTTNAGGQVTAESCMADPSAIEISAADRATMTAAMAWSKDLMDKMADGPFGRFMDASPFKNGLVPLRSTTINGTTRKTSEFVGTSSAALPADTFNIPAGYKVDTLQSMMGRGRGGR